MENKKNIVHFSEMIVQLVDGSIPTPEDPSSNPAIRKFF